MDKGRFTGSTGRMLPVHLKNNVLGGKFVKLKRKALSILVTLSFLAQGATGFS
jgi:hypothetical protein